MLAFPEFCFLAQDDYVLQILAWKTTSVKVVAVVSHKLEDLIQVSTQAKL